MGSPAVNNYTDDPVVNTVDNTAASPPVFTVNVLTPPPGAPNNAPKTLKQAVNVTNNTKIQIGGSPADLNALRNLKPPLQTNEKISAIVVDGTCTVFTCRRPPA
jgi:hypothetical protein